MKVKSGKLRKNGSDKLISNTGETETAKNVSQCVFNYYTVLYKEKRNNNKKKQTNKILTDLVRQRHKVVIKQVY